MKIEFSTLCEFSNEVQYVMFFKTPFKPPPPPNHYTTVGQTPNQGLPTTLDNLCITG